jgi:hypothetical protein
MSPRRVRQHSALAYQQIACLVQHQRRLLFLGLDRNEAHRRSGHRLADRIERLELQNRLEREKSTLLTVALDETGEELAESSRAWSRSCWRRSRSAPLGWWTTFGLWGTGALNIGALHDRYGSWPSTLLPHRKAQKADHQSDHPSVKPVALMEDLCTLVCPGGGRFLDPFGGTGTTAVAARNKNFDCVLIEQNAAMRPVIEDRVRR